MAESRTVIPDPWATNHTYAGTRGSRPPANRIATAARAKPQPMPMAAVAKAGRIGLGLLASGPLFSVGRGDFGGSGTPTSNL